MKNQIEIKKKIKSFNEIINVSGDKSISIRTVLLASQAIGKSKWNSDKKRVEIVDIEYFKAKCVNPPEGIKSLDWIKGGFQDAEC